MSDTLYNILMFQAPDKLRGILQNLFLERKFEDTKDNIKIEDENLQSEEVEDEGEEEQEDEPSEFGSFLWI